MIGDGSEECYVWGSRFADGELEAARLVDQTFETLVPCSEVLERSGKIERRQGRRLIHAADTTRLAAASPGACARNFQRQFRARMVNNSSGSTAS